MSKLYKVLTHGHQSKHGGSATWEEGVWMPPAQGKLKPCLNGYHLCRVEDLIHWFGPEIWEAEYRGELVEHENKVCVREARIVRHIDTWNEVSARLFAAEVAEHVLPIYERIYPADSRPRKAIEATCLSAVGEIGAAACAAAGAAAWAAARAAARDAAWDAARDAARAAARAAAWDAARDAARAAAWDAAGAAEVQWQIACLRSYLAPEA